MLLMSARRSAPGGTQGETSISARMAALKPVSYKQEWNRV